MNYFISSQGITHTGLEPYELFLHLKYGVISIPVINSFNIFRECIDLPNVIFMRNDYTSSELHQNQIVLGAGTTLLSDHLLKKIANSKSIKRVCILDKIMLSSLGITIRCYTMDEADLTPLMRPLLIDEILKEL